MLMTLGRGLAPNGKGLISSAPFLPSNISNLELWLDASDSGTITHSSGSVSQWDDKSGNSNHLSQSTGANQPTTGTRSLNSLNVLDFDGGGDFIDRADALGFTGNPAVTVFVVGETDLTSASTQTGVYIGETNGVGGECVYYYFNDGSYRFNNGNRIFTNSTQNVANISAWKRSGGDTYADGLFYRDGVAQSQVSVGSGSNTLNLQDDLMRIGAHRSASVTGNYFNGKVAEVLIYSQTLSDSEMNQVAIT